MKSGPESDELTVYDRAELESLRDLHEMSVVRQRRLRREAASATSFAVAGGAVMLALGGGLLGVVAVGGIVAGIFFAWSSSE